MLSLNEEMVGNLSPHVGLPIHLGIWECEVVAAIFLMSPWVEELFSHNKCKVSAYSSVMLSYFSGSTSRSSATKRTFKL